MAAMTNHHLRAEIVDVSAVDADTLDRAWQLFDECYAHAQRDRFERDFADKQSVILLSDRCNALRGFSTFEFSAHGQSLVLFSGDTVIQPAFWGQPALPRAFARLLVTHKMEKPERPLYWFLISKGFRTYRMFARSFARATPTRRQDHQDLLQLLHAVASERFGSEYDPAVGLIRYREQHEYVRESLAAVPSTRADDPDVAYFLERNPGHIRGDELACLAEVRLEDPIMRWARKSLSLQGEMSA